MPQTDVKRLAYATMDDAVSFALHVAPEAPDGECVVELIRGVDLDEVLPTAKLIRKMATTFFPDKIEPPAPLPEEEGPMGVYLVVELPELDAADLAALSEEGLPPRPA